MTCVSSPNQRLFRLAHVLARQEGYYKHDTLPRRLNNPGALKYARQREAKCGARGFAHFATPEAGWNASYRDLEAKTNRNMSVTDIIRRRAGPGDNVKRYLQVVREAGF